MPSSWTIGPLVIQSTLGFTIISLIGGVAFFSLFSPYKKDVMKKEREQVINTLFNFVIGIWIGKALIHLSLLFKNPLAVIAYPADRKVFYIALAWVVLGFIYEYFRKERYEVHVRILSILMTIMLAQFIYIFIQLQVQLTRSYLVATLTLGLFLVIVVFLQKYLLSKRAVPILLNLWIICNLGLRVSEDLPFFYFYVDKIFWLILFFLSIVGTVWLLRNSNNDKSYKRIRE